MACGTEFSTGTNMDNLGAWWWDDDAEYDGTGNIFEGWYSAVAEALAAGTINVNNGSPSLAVITGDSSTALNVQYSTPVTSITYEGGVFQINTAGSSSSATVSADYVIVTLKAGSVTFTPPLPSTYTHAISNLGFGNVNKLALLFDTAWWKTAPGFDTEHYFGLAKAGTSERGMFT